MLLEKKKEKDLYKRGMPCLQYIHNKFKVAIWNWLLLVGKKMISVESSIRTNNNLPLKDLLWKYYENVVDLIILCKKGENGQMPLSKKKKI